MYLYGKNSVLERLKASPKTIKRVLLQKGFKSAEIINLMSSGGIPVSWVTEKELIDIKRGNRTQGIVAEVEDFKYRDFDELLFTAKKNKISLIFLDGINDPQNLGSVIRTTACFGGFAIVVPKHRSCEVTDAVMHVASGGENYTPVSRVNNILTAILKAKNSGFWVTGAVVKDGEKLNNILLPFPMCLVLGSEGKGIRPSIIKHLDFKVTLPMEGASLSFNVAMACAIFCYEIDKQRKKL